MKATGRDNRLSIVVMGYVVRGPLGGLTWHHLQYVMGLAALGHTVHFIEDSDDYPCCYDPVRGVTDSDPTYGIEYATRAFDRFGHGESWAYYDAHSESWLGPRAGDIERICASADLLIDVSGVNPVRPWVATIPRRVLIDTDPVFTQVRHLQDAGAMARARAHNVFFTFGENFGRPGCTIPDDGFDWQPTRQPIVVDAWPMQRTDDGLLFTTVMQWDSYRSVDHDGRHYGMKSESFPAFVDLPRRCGPVFELALGGPTAPRDRLVAGGWKLRSSVDVSMDADLYRDYIGRSKGELSIAKHGYVASGSGWFSERSACYLASGRPVIAQETGFSSWLEADAGLIAVTDADSAAGAFDRIVSDYARHAVAAREIAVRHFEAGAVLERLVERAMNRRVAQ